MAYLSEAEYIARYGEPETIRLTDEARAGTIDSAKLATALNDASEEIDGYLASGDRYAVPLAEPVPGIVDRICGDLAREMLHKTRPLEAVTAMADRARTKLRDIAAGRLMLPVAGGGTVESARSARAAWTRSDEPRIFTDEKLGGFGLGG